jgi:hypothetical protein
MSKTCLFLMAMLAAAGSAWAANVYVDANLTSGSNSGSSWADAYRGAQGLIAAMPGTGNTIYVAQGVYKNTTPEVGDNTISLQPGANCIMMGGYNTAVSPPVRDYATYLSIIDGDVNGDDAVIPDLFENPTALAEASSASMIENTKCLVKMQVNGAVLDGFVIKHGNTFPHGGPAGILLSSTSTVRNCTVMECAGGSGAAIDASPTIGQPAAMIENCLITRNTNGDVGIIVSTGGEVNFNNSIVRENSATGPDGDGSGIYLKNPGPSNFHVHDSLFERNTSNSDFGGSFGRQGPLSNRSGDNATALNPSTLDVHNCIVRNNRISDSGGNGGGGAVMIHGPGGGPPILTLGTFENCLIANNDFLQRPTEVPPPTATEAGTGITVRRAAKAVVTNCTVVNNTAQVVPGSGAGAGIGLYTNNGSDGGTILQLRDSIVWGNQGPNVTAQTDSTATLGYSCIDDTIGDPNNIHTGTGVITTNPQMDSAFFIGAASPCKNTGNNTYVTDTLDLSGRPRLNGTVDMGAYEYYLPGDINGSAPVNLVDFELLVEPWLDNDCDASNKWCGNADTNHNGGVDMVDYSTLASEWLQ